MARRGRKSSISKRAESYLRKGPGSYRNLIYGALTVIVLFIFLWLGLNFISNRSRGEITQEAVSTKMEAKTYIVAEGDTLWKISEKVYNDGYQWTKLAEANKIKNPNDIEKGMTLTVPETVSAANPTMEAEPSVTQVPTVMASVTPVPTVTSQPTITPKPTVVAKVTPEETIEPQVNQMPKITGSTYTIKEGDNLWNISVRAYGDGYRWPELARVNKIPNPNLIYPGDKLVLPR